MYTPVQLRLWATALLFALPLLRAEPVISEFMAANATTLLDDDQHASDWIELHNPDATPVNLAGWYLTDSAKKKAKWQLPAVELPARGYLVVFASGKDRRDPARPLHTNFSLDADGEYLALVRPDGTVATEFAPAFPEQRVDVSYGSSGYFSRPTPGAANAPLAPRETVSFSRAAGFFTDSLLLELRGATAGQSIRYVVQTGAMIDGKLPNVTSSSAEYTAPIAINASAVVTAAVFSADGRANGPVSTVHFEKLAPGIAAFSSQLPVLVIDALGAGPMKKDGLDHAAWLYVFAGRANGAPSFAAPPNLAAPLTTSVRGASSAEFPKKSYSVKFTDGRGESCAQALLGLAPAERWALVGPWSYDQGYVNNALIYELSNRLGRWAPRTRLAEVFFKNDGAALAPADYAGIYVVTERIEPGAERVNIATLDETDNQGPDVTGGYLLKIDHATEDEYGWETKVRLSEDGLSNVILVSPKADDITTAQRSYLRDYVQRMENALLADRASGWAQRTYLDYIDRDAWVDHHLLNTFACNPDAFIRSAYFTKDRNGRLAAGPVWDFDRALGSYADPRSFRYEVWHGVGCVDFWRTGWWGVLAQDPEFMQAWIDRWQALRRGDLSDSSIATLVTTLTQQVGTEAAARDATRWPENKSPYGSYAAQVERIRGWTTLRARWIDEQFIAAPTVQADANTLTFTAPAGAQLCYTLDGSDPRSVGGEIAPNARLAPAPLQVPANANIHVRAYRAELKNVFPGSPWSSAVGGAKSSPLAPRSRLVNLSSRALAGTGENALTMGVIVADSAAKNLLARGIGPTLASFGATGAIADPQLVVLDRNGREIGRNQGWQTRADASELAHAAAAVGAFPLAAGSADAALTREVAAGSYSFQLTSAAGQPGIGLAELYELDDFGRIRNLSTRARVRPGEGVLVGGFVVRGGASQRLLVRAVGPTLAGLGVAQALADPVLTIYAGQEVVATNARWSTQENAAAILKAAAAVGAFNLAAEADDAAVLITVPPGAYTIEVKPKTSAGGVALLEIYEVP